MRIRIILYLSLLLLCNMKLYAGAKEVKNDPSFAIRAKEMVSKMTLEEKVSQTMEKSPAIERLGIPAYNWWNEILHGVARSKYKVTVFPQAIGMAANFDRDAIRKMGDMASDEARAIYNKELQEGRSGVQYRGLTFWTPNINIFRDPRWGRGQETYGEDPYLTSELGAAIVEGLEGTHPKYLKVSACAKHYAVHSGPEPLRHVFNPEVSHHDLWNTYLPAFERLVVDAQVSSVMCAYNSLEGKPCCGNENLMMKILRDKWKFNGYAVSDCGAVNNFWQTHKTEPNAVHAAAKSIQSGTDLECGSEWIKAWTYRSLEQAVKDGLLNEKLLDKSVIKLFEIRLRLGMFDDPSEVPYSKINFDVVNATEHKEHAQLMARQSMVLLKNNGVLPLDKSKVKSIAIVGPNANNEVTLLGNYNGEPLEAITPYVGIKRKMGDGVNVLYQQATHHLTSIKDVDVDNEIAKLGNCDIIVFVGGISATLEGEQGCVENVEGEGFAGGDRTSILLPKVQTEYMKRLKSLGKPIIYINMSGSAMSMVWENENVDAIIQAWYAGQAAGIAIADILFGDYNPSGRLPVTFYEKDSDLPNFEDYSMNNRTYRYFTGRPLFEFGFGLSYTSFTYDNIKVVKSSKGYKVTVTVKNIGNHDGDEVVQLYVQPEFTDNSLALKQLKDFSRINIKKGESREVTFDVSDDIFKIYSDKGDKLKVKGRYSICVGGRQPSQEALTKKQYISHSLQL